MEIVGIIPFQNVTPLDSTRCDKVTDQSFWICDLVAGFGLPIGAWLHWPHGLDREPERNHGLWSVTVAANVLPRRIQLGSRVIDAGSGSVAIAAIRTSRATGCDRL
uniref:Uncharacterized protein n=1 Tax=Nelumbo nucifera TaxID=4432 RepID=A0A822ZME6_NELNU|nr:TPA_asm: hypothetical protein HUJ06_002875 [Nelumbo nucifera]